jgi:hypothetical protein
MTSPYLMQSLRSEAAARADDEVLGIAVAWRKIIWRQTAEDEDEPLDRLIAICVRLCDGNLIAGKELATKAIWRAG